MSETGPKRVHRDGNRYYSVSGDELPSVTTVLGLYEPKKRSIDAWKEETDNWKEVRDRAALVGSLAHRRILNVYTPRELPLENIDFTRAFVDAEISNDVEVCTALWNDIKAEIDIGESPMIEQRVWSTEYRYAGTFDMLTANGVFVDLKTSAAIQDSYGMQLAAYAVAAKERGIIDDLSDTSAKMVKLNYREPEARIEELTTVALAEKFDIFAGLLDRFHGGEKPV